MSDIEAIKLQKHLVLLREEYVKLQNKHAELEKKYNLLNSINGSYGGINGLNSDPGDNFISRLLRTVGELFDKDLYSDLRVALKDGRQLRAHKFVLDARSKNWDSQNLSTISELDLSDIKVEIGYSLVKWAYTDTIECANKNDEDFYLEMMKQADRFNLKELKTKCEEGLLTFINVKNCIKFYEVAEQISADRLKAHCNELISNHWDDFTSEDFAHMPASLLYQMFKEKSAHPLHTAIKARREDVVFLYFIENDPQLSVRLNAVDERGDLPLDLALRTRQESIAKSLIKHRVDVDCIDQADHGLSLLHKAVKRGDAYSARFLVDHGVSVNLQSDRGDRSRTALMYLAESHGTQMDADMLELAERVLSTPSVNVNLQDSEGNTALHTAIASRNKLLFKAILANNISRPNFNLVNKQELTVLWQALLQSEEQNDFEDEDSFPSMLIARGCDLDLTDSNGDSLLHLCARASLEHASIFLVNKHAKIDTLNGQFESVLHLACENGLADLVRLLLERGADPNVKTSRLTSAQTPMHKAILNSHEDIVEIFINLKSENKSKDQQEPDFNIKDTNGQTVLAYCLWNGHLNLAKKLIDHGADVNINDADDIPLLHQAILRQCTEAALFLLDQPVDLTARSTDEQLSALQLAVKRHLPLVVEHLCRRGAASMSELDAAGDSPLWTALDTGQEDIASILVRHKCDTTQWGLGPDGCSQTLLHRAIDDNNDAVAVFLIKSGCDINSSRRPGVNGETPDEARDGSTPLHLACAWGQEKIAAALVDHHCELNAQDTDLNTPLHIAVLNQHSAIIEILLKQPNIDLKLKNNQNQTAFATSLMRKNTHAMRLILKKDPLAAEQTDNKGRNFLHLAVISSDIETILALLSVNVNVNTRVQDTQSKTPLHLAVEAGNEMVVRNLLLAGSNVNDLTGGGRRTTLHLAADSAHPAAAAISSVLIENGVDFNAIDSGGNNALHVAVQQGNLAVVECLLDKSDVDVNLLNGKGMSPIHLLGCYGKDNSSVILDLFIKNLPNFNLDQKDAKGNSALLLAYQNGNGNLCRSLIRYGAAIGTYNDEGISIFNHPVATKQLMFKLLDILNKESPWVEAEFCLECRSKFSITNRKHHCRHCGRVLCKKCSEKTLSILKFKIQKPERVCDICFDVLTAART